MKKEPIRILHFVRYMEQGGIQNFIMNVYRKLNTEEIQFDFLVCGKSVFDNEILKMGGKIYYMPYITDIGIKKYSKNLFEFFLTHKEYKIVHSHMNQVTGIILEIAKKANIPIRIAHAHTTSNTNNLLVKMYKRFLQMKINKNATDFFACSIESAKWLYKEKSNQAIIVNNGIDIEKFKYDEQDNIRIRKELSINKKTIVVGHIGRFSAVKNHEFLIQVFNDYVKINNDAILILVGTGELQENIKKIVYKNNLKDKVLFLNNRNDTDSLYSCFNCYLFPSLYEGISLTLIEAQCAGCNILASDTIDKNTNITGTIMFEKLNQSSTVWAKEIANMKLYNRYNNYDKLKDTTYNITNTVNILTKFYEQKYININGEKQ